MSIVEDIKKCVSDNCVNGGFITLNNNVLSVKEHNMDNKDVKNLCDNVNDNFSGICITTNTFEIKVMLTQPRKRGI